MVPRETDYNTMTRYMKYPHRVKTSCCKEITVSVASTKLEIEYKSPRTTKHSLGDDGYYIMSHLHDDNEDSTPARCSLPVTRV